MIDDPARLEKLTRQQGWPVDITTITHPHQARDVIDKALPVLPLKKGVDAALLEIKLGKAVKETSPAVIGSIKQAVDLAKTGAIAAIITNPIQKSSLIESGFRFPGHTEFLDALTQEMPMAKGQRRGPVMMLASQRLRVVPLTVHCPLQAVAGLLTQNMIVEKVEIVAQSLVRDLGLKSPRIAIAGLNPHAGEQGAIGKEEIETIIPAMKLLRRKGIRVFGPVSADSLFHEAARNQYDVAITMYHDQGLIPIKTLSFFDAANITLGLPIIRTSPDHGTGLDIADKNIARPDSLIAAILMADQMVHHRSAFDAQAEK